MPAQKHSFPVIATLLSLIGILFLSSLGLWQVKRLAWKEDLLIRIAQGAEEVKPFSSEDLTAENLYQTGVVQGRFASDQEILLQGKTYDGELGYNVITPMLLRDGGAVLVNRGWAPLSYEGSVQEITEITGMIRPITRPNAFTPPNDPAGHSWFWFDLDALQMSDAAPVWIVPRCEENALDQIPNPCGVTFKINNNHLQYAIFWFVMAGVLGLFYYLRFWRN